MEHNPWDGRALRDSLQYMLNRAQIVKSGSLAPSVTPMVRVPVNGIEKGQWHAKQALDIGCYGIVWPHISTVEEAYNAVAACRYPRLKTAKNFEPAGIRGDGPTGAVRYWGLRSRSITQGRRLAARSKRRDLRASCRSRTCAGWRTSTRC
jgi:4-hydroxy-2-oxoheptanedioate aldolase